MSFHKEPSILEQKAYRDTWGRGLDSYLQWFYEVVILLRELLAEDGSIYVHLDWHVGHYAKTILDEVFGSGALHGQDVPGFRSEIAWCYSGGGIPQREFPRKHDTIFWYTKGTTWTFNAQYRPYSPGTVERGRTAIKGPDAKLRVEGTPVNDWWSDVKKITSPTDPEKVYFDTQKSEDLLARIIKTSTGEPVVSNSTLPDLVLDCFCGSGTTAAVAEKLNRRWIACDLGRFAIHTTRKRLLGIAGVKPFIVQNLGKYERQAWQVAEFQVSREGELLRSAQHDTTGSVTLSPSHVILSEAKNPRSSLRVNSAKDPGRSQSRDSSPPEPALSDKTGTLRSAQGDSRSAQHDSEGAPQSDRPGEPPPHVTLSEAKGLLEEQRQREAAYRKFILELYHATPITGRTWLHGLKGGRMVQVGAVDAPVTLADVKAIARETWKAVASGKDAPTEAGADILGWDFAFELNETAKQVAAESHVHVAFKKIPREVLDKKAVEQGDVKFFELGALDVKMKQKGRELALTLHDFVIPYDDIPKEAQSAIKHWSQLVDYWAVDWDYKNDTFHNQWQSYRTRRDPKIELAAKHTYPAPGKYSVVVKVIDILGNDTTKTVEILM